jgi:hypothetical protein
MVGGPTADSLGIAPATGLARLRLAVVLGAWSLSARLLSRFYKDRPFRFASEKVHKAIMVKMGGMHGVAFDVPPEFVARWFPENGPGGPRPA